MQHVRFFCEIFGSKSTRRRGSIGSARATRRGKRVPESQQLGLCFADLPSHIITLILLRLPIKCVLICKCVCRSWKALISDPHFAKLHFEHAPDALLRAIGRERVSRILHLLEFEPENFESDDDEDLLPECNSHLKLENKLKLPLRGAKLVLDKRDETTEKGRQMHYISTKFVNKLKFPLCGAKPVLDKRDESRQMHYISSKPEHDKFAVVNSCNGFLCLSHLGRDDFVVCNPVTGEFIRLPEATRVDNTDVARHQEVYCGFGFQPKSNEYKVVRILKRYLVRFQETKEFIAVEMHTLGSSTWKNVDVDPRDFKWLDFPVLFKGLGFPTCVSGALHWISFYYRTILCFDFNSERFQSFPSPPHLFEDKKDTRNIVMGELRGSIYICDSSFSSSVDAPVKMWIMKKYGLGKSWTKVFSIETLGGDPWPYGGLYWPVRQFKNGAAILMYHSSNCFIYYEPKKYRFKMFKVHGTRSTFEVIPHIPNLISLKDAVKGNNIEVLNVHSRCAQSKLHEENEVLFLAKVNFEVSNLCSTNYEDYGNDEDDEEEGEEPSS